MPACSAARNTHSTLSHSAGVNVAILQINLMGPWHVTVCQHCQLGHALDCHSKVACSRKGEDDGRAATVLSVS